MDFTTRLLGSPETMFKLGLDTTRITSADSVNQMTAEIQRMFKTIQQSDFANIATGMDDLAMAGIAMNKIQTAFGGLDIFSIRATIDTALKTMGQTIVDGVGGDLADLKKETLFIGDPSRFVVNTTLNTFLPQMVAGIKESITGITNLNKTMEGIESKMDRSFSDFRNQTLGDR